MSIRATLAAATLGLGLVLGALAPEATAAQWDANIDVETRRPIESPENFVLELRIGPYQPQMDDTDAFRTVFGDDRGPMLGLELDLLLLRLDEVLAAGIGLGVSRAGYRGDACLDLDICRDPRATEETRLSILPLTALAVVRIDVLARKLNIPFIFTGKIGFDHAYWRTSHGTLAGVTGWSTGLRMAGQVALDLNFFEPRAARNLDEEWGINRTFLFFEWIRVETLGDDLPLGDTTWAAGLGFIF